MTVEDAYRVVLADDVAEIRQIVTLMLEATGSFHVVGDAPDGLEAVEVARRLQPDVVILDADMPRMGGPEAVPLVREAAPEAIVVILSGSAVAPTEGLLADAWLEKGIGAGDLADALRALFGARAGHHESGPTPADPRSAAAFPDDAEALKGLLAAIVESSDDAIISSTLDGTIVTWNTGAERLFGYRRDEIVGRPGHILVPPDRPDEGTRTLSRIREGERVAGFETIRMRKDGMRVEVAMTVSPVVTPDGRLVGASAIVRNITGRRSGETALARAVAQLERQNRELARSNEELDAFAYVVSHDLAQPLQVVYGYLELLTTQYGAAFDDRGRGWLEVSLRNLDRTRALVRDVLAFARAGSSAGVREPVDLRVLVDEVREGLGDTDGDVVVEGDLPAVVGDRGQLAQVLQNLIANGLKFHRADRPAHVRVAATLDRDRDEVEVAVTDNGIGIAAEDRDRVFEMFQRVGDKTAFPGTGVGLAICRKIVERHGGRIWVEAGPEGGASFRFALPAADVVTD